MNIVVGLPGLLLVAVNRNVEEWEAKAQNQIILRKTRMPTSAGMKRNKESKTKLMSKPNKLGWKQSQGSMHRLISMMCATNRRCRRQMIRS